MFKELRPLLTDTTFLPESQKSCKCFREVRKIFRNYFEDLWWNTDNEHILSITSLAEAIYWSLWEFLQNQDIAAEEIDGKIGGDLAGQIKIEILLTVYTHAINDPASSKQNSINIEETIKALVLNLIQLAS